MPRRRRVRPNIPFLCAVGVFVLAIATYIGVGVLWAILWPRHNGIYADWTLPLLARTLDAVTALWFFAVGASIGSFLNVVAYRLPRGKTLLGNSACPYCCAPISAADNIPVFAWLRLRGRCRTCRLPISMEYPLIEFMVGLVFLAVYFTEFAVAGTNLPGSAARPVGSGLVWMSVTPLLATRVLVYLFTLSGLIAAALIAFRRVETPLTLFGWVLMVVAASHLMKPTSVVVPWWFSVASYSATRMDAVLTIGLGWLAGLMAAALTLPLLQRATHQIAWYGTLSCVGAIIGWQWVATATACILLSSLLLTWLSRGLLHRRMSRWAGTGAWADPVVWAWLGFLLFRANWKALDGFFNGLQTPTSWMMLGVCASVALVAAWLVGRTAQVEGLQQPAGAIVDDAEFSAPAKEANDAQDHVFSAPPSPPSGQ